MEFETVKSDIIDIDKNATVCKNCKDFLITGEIKEFGKCQNKSFNDFILMKTKIHCNFGCRFFNKD